MSSTEYICNKCGGRFTGDSCPSCFSVTVYCAHCEAEAICRTNLGTPLCWTCGEVYKDGMANPDGNVTLLEDEEGE